jgi:hypothetical protein
MYLLISKSYNLEDGIKCSFCEWLKLIVISLIRYYKSVLYKPHGKYKGKSYSGFIKHEKKGFKAHYYH